MTNIKDKILKMFSVDADTCRVPLCKNKQAIFRPFCNPCMETTLDRFIQSEGIDLPYRRKFWEDYIIKHVDKLIEFEEATIKARGADYDRNSEE